MRTVLAASLFLVLAGCGDDPPAQPQTATPPPPQTERERLINNTQAASAVGYDGDAVKRSVQGMVNAADKQQATLQETMKPTPDPAADPDASK